MTNVTGADRAEAVQPARSGVARWVVIAFVAAVPATVTGLLLLHPAGNGEALLGSGARYYWLHLVLLFGFPATAVVLVVLLRGLRTPESWIARVAAFVYACTYGAYDALAGITIAAYTMRAEEAATRRGGAGHPRSTAAAERHGRHRPVGGCRTVGLGRRDGRRGGRAVPGRRPPVARVAARPVGGVAGRP